MTGTQHHYRRDRSGGLLLCGGQSSRMGYEKARLRFPGGTLLERMLGRMREVVSPVALSLAPGQEVPPLPPDVIAVPDSQAGQGPLQGLMDGFRALAGRCDRVLVLAVDLPLLTPEWMAALLDGLEGRRACLYEHEGFANALTAAYDMALLPKLERLVAEGARRPLFLSRDEPTRILPAGDPEEGAAHPLTDVDTPEAYRAALLAEGVGTPGGAEVTIEVPEGAGGTSGNLGFVALHARTAGEALEFTRRLYPERFGPGGGTPRLARGGDPAAALAPETPLAPGERLMLISDG